MSWHEELLSVASLFLLSSLFYCTCSSAVPFSLLPRLFNPTSLIGSTSRLNSVARIFAISDILEFFRFPLARSCFKGDQTWQKKRGRIFYDLDVVCIEISQLDMWFRSINIFTCFYANTVSLSVNNFYWISPRTEVDRIIAWRVYH